jgi:uncharacterized membrane protein
MLSAMGAPGEMTGTVSDGELAATPVAAGGHLVIAFYAAAIAGMAVLLLSRQFVYVWAPIQKWVPGRDLLASCAGALLLLGALGMFWRKTGAAAAAILAVLFVAWLVLLQAPRLIAAPSREILWSGAAQILSVVAGSFILFAESSRSSLAGSRAIRVARILYGIALPVFGLHHFLSMPGAAEAVPAWLPARAAWVYLTGAAHVAAGLALLFGIVPRLAATLEAIMISAFVVLVHVTGVVAAPRDGLQWTMLFVAAVIGGAAWIVARSYAHEPRPHPISSA